MYQCAISPPHRQSKNQRQQNKISSIVKKIVNNTQSDSACRFLKFERCGLDDGIGCSNLGLMYESGTGVRQSNTKALEYYGEACDLKSKLGCENYAKSKDR